MSSVLTPVIRETHLKQCDFRKKYGRYVLKTLIEIKPY